LTPTVFRRLRKLSTIKMAHARIAGAPVQESQLMINRKQILEQALALPVEDRACLLAALAESLPATNPAGSESASELLEELRRRSAAFRAGETIAKFATEVLDDQRRKYC
jgi:hypothetical protein